MTEAPTALDVLRWHRDAGVDETIGDTPLDRFQLVHASPAAQSAPQAARQAPAETARPLTAASGREAPPQPSDEMIKSAKEAARQATSVDELRRVLEAFDGCALKKTATNLVFADGSPSADLMLVGEAPGAQEDRQGVPFVGPSGELLNKMLASIAIQRSDVLISNTVFWRPPGNRTPTLQETAICAPFLDRLIELVQPKVLVALGGPASKALLGESQGIGRLRGRWFSYQRNDQDAPIDAAAMFHPAYLLRTPTQKRSAWQDLLMIKEKLSV